MKTHLFLEKLTIIIAYKNFNSNILTPKFLKDSGIVPSEWQLSHHSLVSRQVTQVSYTNGICFLIQANTITFSEPLNSNVSTYLRIPEIAHKYVKTLPNADYQTVTIGPYCFITFPEGDDDAPRQYITSTFLAPGAWHQVGKASVRAALKLSYSLEQGKFNLSVTEANLQLPDSSSYPSVSFFGSFPYDIPGNSSAQRLEHAHQLIDQWQANLDIFQNTIRENFLE